MTLEERKNYALSLRMQGYNCAQCVVSAFQDVTGIDKDMTMRIASGLGSGVGGLKEICGVITGMAIAEGLVNDSRPTTKIKVADTVKKLAARFSDKNGCIRCSELKGKSNPRSCNELIIDGIEILHHHFMKND